MAVARLPRSSLASTISNKGKSGSMVQCLFVELFHEREQHGIILDESKVLSDCFGSRKIMCMKGYVINSIVV